MAKHYQIILRIMLSVILTASLGAQDNEFKNALEIKPWSRELQILVIDLPSGWKHEYRKGPDYDLYYASDELEGVTIGIYIGLHPNIYKEKAEKIRASFPSIKKKTIWLAWKKKKGEDIIFHREALIKGPYSNANKIKNRDMRSLLKKIKFHIFLTAKTPDGMTKAVNVVSSMHFE